MDKIYPPDKFPCSEPIDLKTYFKDFSELRDLKSEENTKNFDRKQLSEYVLDSMKVFNKKKRKELEVSCSIDLLTVEGECPPHTIEATSKSKAKIKMKKQPAVTPQAKMLKTVRAREELGPKYRNLFLNKRDPQEPYVCQTSSDKSNKSTMEPGSEFIVAIRIYHPFELIDPATNSFNNLKFSHEIILTGSNTLAELRDKILCHADIGLCVEMETPIVQFNIGDSKKKYPSGFIFIENTFYNDTREENCIDYSEVIFQWAKEKNIGPLKTACLQTTRIDDLQPRFGYPYVYQHQGNCEHILTFSDAWLLSYSDSMNRNDYPFYRGIHRLRSKHCTLCYASTAKWICTESDRLPHNKTFMCQDCLLQYNYKDGEKIGSFKLFPYFERSRLT